MNNLVSRLSMFLLASLPAIDAWGHPDDAPPVPAGVNYAPAPGDEFRAQVDDLLACLQNADCPLPMGRMVVVGPRLAVLLERATPALSNLGSADINLSGEIEGFNSLFRMPGRFAQTTAETDLLAQALRSHLLTGETLAGRRLTGDELQVYWALIPFDIVDPVFIVETSTATTMFQLTPDGVIMWLDEIVPVLTDYVEDSCMTEEACYTIFAPDACAVELDRIDACVVDECSVRRPRRGREERAEQCARMTQVTGGLREAQCRDQLLQSLRALSQQDGCEQLVETFRAVVDEM